MTDDIPTHFASNEDALSFLTEYCTFGRKRAYILLAIARPKDNDYLTHTEKIAFREIITDEDSLRRKYTRLQTLAENYIEEDDEADTTFRLYITANARDIQEAFYDFQKQLTEFGYKLSTGHEGTLTQIGRLDKEWISTLQSGGREDDYFIMDIDSSDEKLYTEFKDHLSNKTKIIECLKTPNGFHIITKPFNYAQFEPLEDNKQIETKTDGLMFIRTL